MEDILGLGKVLPMDKLIDVVSGAVGKISKPYFDRRDVDTKAYEIRKLAEAKADEIRLIGDALRESHLSTSDIKYTGGVLAIASGDKTDPRDLAPEINSTHTLQERTSNRLSHKEQVRQLNIETVTSKAAEELLNSEPVSDEMLDEDWVVRYFNIVEDISNDDMQNLWARILAGEIKKPKSYSIRSLELLRNISTDEAEIFSRFSQLRLKMGSNTFVSNSDDGKYLMESQHIDFKQLLLLAELGLISTEDNLELSFPPTEATKSTIVVECGALGAILYRNENVPMQAVQVLIFTKIGEELANLVDQLPNPEYLRSFCSHFKHPAVKILQGTLVRLPNNQFQLVNQEELV